MRYLLLQWPKTGILWERLLFVVRVGDNPRQLGGWLDESFASLELCPFFLILYFWKERTGLSFRDVGTIYSMLKYLLCFFLEWMRVGSHNATLVEGWILCEMRRIWILWVWDVFNQFCTSAFALFFFFVTIIFYLLWCMPFAVAVNLFSGFILKPREIKISKQGVCHLHCITS